MATIHADAVNRIDRIAVAPRVMEGEGFEVRRALPAARLPAVGPFIFLDHFGPVTYGPGEAKGAPNHPHRGFETLTWLLQGSGVHRDSLGNVSTIGADEGQWMRAGSGILHDEGPDAALRRDGGAYEGVQFWINLPQGRKMTPPAYRAIERGAAPVLTIGDAEVTLIAGRLGDATGPIETWANPWLALVDVPAGGHLSLAPGVEELGLYVVSGDVELADCRVSEGELAVLASGGDLALTGRNDARFFVLGGDPLDAPLRRYGPFVMNTDAEIQSAVRDFQAGKFGSIPAA